MGRYEKILEEQLREAEEHVEHYKELYESYMDMTHDMQATCEEYSTMCIRHMCELQELRDRVRQLEHEVKEMGDR